MKRPKFLHKAGVYRIRNVENGKCYVGSSVRLNVRFGEHVNRLNSQTHTSRYLRSSWRKYSADSFVFEVLAYCAPEHAVWFEQLFLDALKPEYNTCRVAGSTLGTRRTEEAKAKMRAARVGIVFSAQHLENLRLAAQATRGVKRPPRSAEWRQKIADSQRGRTHAFSDEHRANLSKSQLGNKKWLGKKHSEETKAKIAVGQRGKARFDDDTIRTLRFLVEFGCTQQQIADTYGVSRRLIGMIAAKKAYAWVTEHPQSTETEVT